MITKMLSMLFFGFGLNEDVINVYDDEFVEVLMEYRVHKPHEGSRGIGETKGQDGFTRITHNG